MGLMIRAGNSTATGTNLQDRWTAEDSKEYERIAQCISDEYSGFEATEGVKLNGKLTLGENTADNGALRIALMALESTLSQHRLMRIQMGLRRNRNSSYPRRRPGARTPLTST